MDRSNRYKIPAKREAYEHALRLAKAAADIGVGAIGDIAQHLDQNLSREVRHQIAAKALRVERGRRWLWSTIKP